MKIQRISVNNFRSIREAHVDLDSLSIFVGQNNHGKTNFFEAIDWFYNAKTSQKELYFELNDSNTIQVEVSFIDVSESDIERLSSDTNKTKIRGLLNGETSFRVVKTSSDHKRTCIINGQSRANPVGFDTALNEFLPKLEYVTTKNKLEDVSQYKDKNPIGQMLSGVLTAIVSESEDYRNFRQQFNRLFEAESSEVRIKLNELGTNVANYLKKQFPDNVDVKFTVNPPEFSDLLKSFDTQVDDGIATRAQDKGDGMQRAIMLAIIQAFADFRRTQSSGISFLFLLDEAELHLHPSAQRLLKKALEDISETDQVLLNTHSSVMVVEDCTGQKLFKVEKHERVTAITPVQEIEKIDVIYELLGGSPHDLLLPRNFLIVEGKSEYEFLIRVIKRFYSEDFKGLKVLFACGDLPRQVESIEAVHRTLTPLVGIDNAVYRDRLVVLIDRPNPDQQRSYRTFKSSYAYMDTSHRLFELPCGSLEEYYPSPWTKTAEEVRESGDVPGWKTGEAITVSESITQEAFEEQMSVLYSALRKCHELAFA